MTLLKTHSRAKEMRESARRERTRFRRLPVSSPPTCFQAVCPPLTPASYQLRGEIKTPRPPQSGSYTSCCSVSSQPRHACGQLLQPQSYTTQVLLLRLKPCLFMNQLVSTVDRAGFANNRALEFTLFKHYFMVRNGKE